MPEDQLATQETRLATTEPSIGQMLQGALASGITKDNADALGKMLDVYERMEDRRSQQQYASAFVALQSEMPEIVAQSVIPNRGRYERFEDVMHVVGPLLRKNGFAVSFTQEADDKRITATCTMRHTGGHFEKTPFAVRLGGKADSDTQADCKASTTAKRNALLFALNIVIRQDCLQDEDDAKNIGGPITQQQADELRDWVEATHSNVERFLAFADAKTFETINSGRLPELHAELRRAESIRK